MSLEFSSGNTIRILESFNKCIIIKFALVQGNIFDKWAVSDENYQKLINSRLYSTFFQ